MSLYIEKLGRGPVSLVLLHGWAMHGGVLAPLAEALADRCTMHVVDLPGHGWSRDCGLPLEPSACAAAIAAATPPALWLGWSLGGLIALAAALEQPRQVRGLAMLCATPKFTRDESWPWGSDATLVHQLALDLETDYDATIDRFLALESMGSADPRAALRHLRDISFARGKPNLRVLQEGIRILETSDLRTRLPSLRQSNAWIAGRRDRLVPPQAMAWSAQQSHGSYTQIEHAGHAPFVAHADEVAQALQPLLDSFHE
ncbi:pimeloyl-ACP methyl ester esterase BioH [Dyella agri]|uniref:Pimeloyl-[acyl-carrier protein] methyl ester esterase n=1 Tax=Dyella agri TaxID=1926869 RepID=A0ABW8KGV4_9GAMM